jgi:lysophospholipase L1-like esterase
MRNAPDFLRLATALTVAATAVLLVVAPVRAENSAPSPACVAPNDLNRLDLPLTRTARRIAAGQSITIVAVGSSSTSGAGASSPAMNYPSRLEAELKILFPRISIAVINRGVGGETAPDMLARFESQVLAENPDIVVWQLGSNSVLREQPIAPANELIHRGVKQLKAAGIDVILMNPQYAPKVIAKPDIDQMVDLINLAAKETNVNLFQRFAMMRYWRLTEDLPFSAFLSPDELHLNDWSYGCIAKMLAREIADAVTRPTMTAGAGATAAR